jgi:hypothetical protein
MEEENTEQPPFRWNWQVTVILCLTALALAVPVAGVLLIAKGALEPRPAPAIDTSALERGLETVSSAHFSAAGGPLQETIELSVAPGDAAARIARIGEIARVAGGSALELSESNAAVRRLMVQVPAARAELFKRAVRGEPVDFSAIPVGAETQLLEITLKAP